MALPKLIVSDVDGTLLTGPNEVNKRTRDVLKRCVDQGIKVILATGRPPMTVEVITDQIPHSGMAICANGALTYDLTTKAVVQHDALDLETGLAVMDTLRAIEPDLLFATATDNGLWLEPLAHEHTEASVWTNARVADSAEAMFAHDVFKLVGWHKKNECITERGYAMAQSVADQVYLTWSGDFWIEMSSPGINKATAVSRLCADWQIDPSDVLAFGDMPNDIELLTWAGTGVAMGNATPDVKAIADHVTAAHYDSGVAVFLERLLVGLDPLP